MERIVHIAAFLCAVTLGCCGSQALGQGHLTPGLISPPFLHAGDTVAIVATSYEPSDSIITKSCTLLRSWGFEPVVAPNIASAHVHDSGDSIRHYAGDVSQRAAGLEWALENDSVKALLCARGGYGAIQLLGKFPVRMFRRHPKWLVGYSDVTTLHCALVSEGVMSLHGQMCNSFCGKEGPDDGALKLRDFLLGNVPQYEIPSGKYNSCGRAEGILVGGNMVTMAALLDTEFDPTSRKNIILFFEEVDESMHDIDRIFNMFLLRGKFKNVRGIVFGSFESCSGDLPYESVEQMLYQYTSKLGIPVCYGFPVGHGKENVPLVEGAAAVLDVGDESVKLSFIL